MPIDDLYDTAFGADGVQVWTEMPAVAEPAIDIFIYPPRAARPFYTLVTSGISAKALPAPTAALRHIELVMYLAPTWVVPEASGDSDERTWPLDLLRTLGRMAHDRPAHFEPADTIPNKTSPPTPYASSTQLAAALVLPLPELDAALSPLRVDGLEVTLLRVVPITATELDLKKRERTNALLKRFREHDLPLGVDPGRASVV
jgi:hypothetical protein